MRSITITSNTSPITVFGIFNTRLEVQKVVKALKKINLANSDISVIMSKKIDKEKMYYENPSRAPEGAIVGVMIGAILGGILGWTAGIGLIAFPGLTPFMAVGPIISTLTGLTLGSAFGGLAGTLIGIGVPETKYKRRLQTTTPGRILVAAHVNDPRMAARTKRILVSCGGDEVKSEQDKKIDTRGQSAMAKKSVTVNPYLH